MTTGHETKVNIIDQWKEFIAKNDREPQRIKLPSLMACDLAKCGRNEIGELSSKCMKRGIKAFEEEGLWGMEVQIIHEREAKLEFD